jgi:hypothetical protein
VDFKNVNPNGENVIASNLMMWSTKRDVLWAAKAFFFKINLNCIFELDFNIFHYTNLNGTNQSFP